MKVSLQWEFLMKFKTRTEKNTYLDRILLWSFSFFSFFRFFLSFLSFLPRILLSNSYFRRACNGVSESVSLDVELGQKKKLYLCDQIITKFVTGYWTPTKIKLSYYCSVADPWYMTSLVNLLIAPKIGNIGDCLKLLRKYILNRIPWKILFELIFRYVDMLQNRVQWF
jgi:hypothetical protein